MADTHETHRSDLNAGDALRELFEQRLVPGKDVVWLADQVIAIAQHLGSIELECVPQADGWAIICRDDSTQQGIAGRNPLRFFRPLLARLAVLGADETGNDPQLYGGRYSLLRSSQTGPIRLEVAFTNTSNCQQVTITRVPVGIASNFTDPPPHPSA